MFKQMLVIGSILFIANAAHATTLYDESVSGDLSNLQSAPTALNLSVGTNSINGTVGTAADQQDWVALRVPAGTQLSSLFLASYSSADAQGFMGVQAGSSFVGSTNTPGNYLGYVHYGTGATNNGPATNVVNTDLMPLLANPAVAAGAQGFTPPLGAGTYTFLIQQLGASTNYGFDFVDRAVPEPGMIGVMALSGITMMRRRASGLRAQSP
jgi:hypothetical protein